MKQKFRAADPMEGFSIETRAKLASTRLLQLKAEVYRTRPCLVCVDSLLSTAELTRLRSMPYDILTVGVGPTRQLLDAGAPVVAAYWSVVAEEDAGWASGLRFLIATPENDLQGDMRIAMDTFHENYPNVSTAEWDGSASDAAQKLGSLLHYSSVMPFAEARWTPFHILTQMWRPQSNRRWRELCAALRRNAENPYVTAIHVLMETEAVAEAWSGWPAELQAKIRAKPYEKRLNYCDARTIMLADMPEDAFMALINADIYFDETLRELWAADMSGDGRCFALLRYEASLGWAEKGEGSEPKIFGPRDDSQDAWIFPGRTLRSRAAAGENWDTLTFTLGQAGCDNTFAGELVRRRWIIANPCMSIRTLHVHESGIRTHRADDLVTLGIYATLAPCGLLESRLLRAANFSTHSTLRVETLKSVYIAPWTGGARGAEAYQRGLSDIYKTLERERIVDSVDKVERKEETLKLLSATGATVTADGLVSVGTGIGFSDDRQASELAWAQTQYTSLSPVVCEERALFLPFSDGTLGDEFLNVGRALWLRSTVGPVCLPSLYDRLIAQLIRDSGVTLRNLGNKGLYCKEAYGLLPSLVHGGAAWLQPALDALRAAFGIGAATSYPDRGSQPPDGGYVTYGLSETVDDYLEGEVDDVTVLLKSAAPARIISALKAAKVCISKVAGGKFMWALGSGGTYIDLAPTSAAAMIANMCGVRYVPLTFREGELDEDIGRVVLEAARGSTATATNEARHIVYMPSPRQGYHGHPGDSFRELVELWAEAGYIERRYHDGVFIWLDEVGANGSLLYDRDLLEWLDSAPEAEKSWKQALFGNEQSEKGKAWIYWARRPRLLERRAPIAARTRGLVFYGRIENSKQFKLRSAKSTGMDWSAVCDEFVMPVGAQYKYTQAEYLDRLAEAKFGLCLPGYGPKCHREIECMALGVVPVITPGIDTAGYAEPLVEGIHYLSAANPETARAAIAACSEEQWQRMSAAGRAWYERNASVAGSWAMTQKLLEAEAEADPKVQ